MKIELQVGKEYVPSRVVIYTEKVTPEIEKLVEILQNYNKHSILGYSNEEIYLLNEEEIETFYTQQGKIFARIEGKEYQIKKRIYELEEILPKYYIRISNSEIVNFRKIEKLDMSISGTICLIFKNGEQTYVSRRQIKVIKEYLKI